MFASIVGKSAYPFWGRSHTVSFQAEKPPGVYSFCSSPDVALPHMREFRSFCNYKMLNGPGLLSVFKSVHERERVNKVSPLACLQNWFHFQKVNFNQKMMKSMYLFVIKQGIQPHPVVEEYKCFPLYITLRQSGNGLILQIWALEIVHLLNLYSTFNYLYK